MNYRSELDGYFSHPREDFFRLSEFPQLRRDKFEAWGTPDAYKFPKTNKAIDRADNATPTQWIRQLSATESQLKLRLVKAISIAINLWHGNVRKKHCQRYIKMYNRVRQWLFDALLCSSNERKRH